MAKPIPYPPAMMALLMPITYALMTPLALFTLDSGSWETRGHGAPADATPEVVPVGEPIPVAVPLSLADSVNLNVGDHLTFNTSDQANPVEIEIAGIWMEDNPEDPIWFTSPNSSGPNQEVPRSLTS